MNLHPSRHRRVLRSVALGGAAVIGLAACGGSSSGSTGPSGSVNVALNTSLSGPFGYFGFANQNAIKLGVEQVNSSGGLNGKTINLEVKDDGTKADTGTELVRSEILNDKVVALFGGVSSSVALAEQTLAGKYKVPFLVHTSNTDKLTVQKFNDYTFSLGPNTGMEGRANAIAAAKLPYTKYYLIGPDYEFGHSQIGAFKAKLKELKPEVQFVGEDYPKLGATDYGTYISKIGAAKPEIVYSAEFGGDLITFLTQGKGTITGGSSKLMGLFDVDTLRTLGASAPTGAYGYSRAPFFAIKGDHMDKFVKAYQDRYNVAPSDWAVIAYDAFELWVQGVKKAGSFDGTKVSAALSGASFDSVRGPLTVRALDHQVDCSEYEGTLAADPKAGFDTFADPVTVAGKDILLTEAQVKAARSAA
ncbi:MAG TPA: ABC transporter substrate-binding protein [Candidatus Dormibacteraeota bacterium]|nr:ABC transporter substrate-binding protein [Candidatus Dormibacteraeota bacterium]